MTESEFNQQVDELLLAIEEAIEASGAEIDYDTSAGILTLEFENASKVIVNRQPASQQIWVAAKSGGFHLDYLPQQQQWQLPDDGETLVQLLSRVCSEQTGESVSLVF